MYKYSELAPNVKHDLVLGFLSTRQFLNATYSFFNRSTIYLDAAYHPGNTYTDEQRTKILLTLLFTHLTVEKENPQFLAFIQQKLEQNGNSYERAG